MDDIRVGRICRALRRRRGWRQLDLARRVGCHQTTVSRLERGQLEHLDIGLVRRILRELGASFDGTVAWRAGDLDHLLDERHAAIVERIVAIADSLGWAAISEATYSIYGERGSIDVFGANRSAQAVVVFEIKTDIPRVEEAARRHDEKVRLAPKLAIDRFGFRPAIVASVLVMPEDARLRRRVLAHEATFRSRYPADSHDVRAWLRKPDGPLHGIWFLSPKRMALGSQRPSGPRRVRRPLQS
jgi:transcriptional regulator with XRE-family HTH domain